MDELIRQILYFTQVYKILYRVFPSWKPPSYILCYHRVVDYHEDDIRHELKLNVPTKLFKRQIKYFRARYRFITPDEMLNDKVHGILLTFDDGMYDFVDNVLPFIRKFKIPSILYVSTKNVSEQNRFWWDRLYDALSRADLCYNERISLCEKLKYMPVKKRAEEIRRLEELNNLSYQREPGVMSWSDIELLRENEVTIGSHGHTHQVMTVEPIHTCEKELDRNIQSFKKNLNNYIPEHFAYPNGGRNDFNETIKKSLTKFGFKSAVTTLTGGVSGCSDPLSLPRILVYDEPLWKTIARIETAGVWSKISGFYHRMKNKGSLKGIKKVPVTDAKNHFSETVDEYISNYSSEDCYSYSFGIRKKHILEMLTEHPGNLLDIGCGPGVLTKEISRTGWNTFNMDISFKMLLKSKKLYQDRNTHFLNGDIQNIPFNSSTFDFIIASGVLEYLPETGSSLNALDRVLAENGRIILTIPTSRHIYTIILKILSKILKREVGGTLYEHHLISPEKLKKECRDKGWIIIEEAYYHFIFFPLDHFLPGVSLWMGRKLENLLGRTPFFCRLGKGYIIKCLKPLTP